MQDINIYVRDFSENSTPLSLLDKFNFKLYKRDGAKSYREGEKQSIPYDLNVFPNSPPVDSDHIFVEIQKDVSNPYTISVDDEESYLIIIWADNYLPQEKRFYVHKNDGINTGDFPGDIYIDLVPYIPNNASLFI